MSGYDIETINKIIDHINIPLIISGGAGSKEDIYNAFNCGASAASISSLFHFKEITPKEIKEYLKEKNIPVRL